MAVGPDGPVDGPGSPFENPTTVWVAPIWFSTVTQSLCASVSQEGFSHESQSCGKLFLLGSFFFFFFMALFILPTNVATMLLIEDQAMFTNFYN